MKLTITEALAEIKTIDKRLAKKREAIRMYVVRDGHMKDPLKSEGGSEVFIDQTRQSIRDLEKRIVDIRTAIQGSNLITNLSVNGTERSVSEWLTWRREVAPKSNKFLCDLNSAIDDIRKTAQQKGRKLIVASESTQDMDVLVSLNEIELLKEVETSEEILGLLDGKLSLNNALTTIEVE